MKFSNNLLLYSFSLLLFLGLSACVKDDCEREVTYLQSTPIYMTKDAIRQDEPVVEAARSLEHPGQFYYYNQYILIAEKGEGIHIIDNRDPHTPRTIAFLNIPGADNMAVKNNILYVNNFIDLLAIDISNIEQAHLIGRTADVFPPLWEDITTGQVLVRYDINEVTEKMDCASYSNLRNWGGVFVDNATFNTFEAGGVATGSDFSNGGVGIGGSLARFSIIGDYLYSVSDTDLDVISLQQAEAPQRVNTINLGWGIETIFPYQDKLFIGSNSGMFIFDNSNPAAPTQLSAFAHARACDPVFVKDNYAYVTLRDGSTCEGFVNQMDLVDITDLTNPILEKSFPMANPHGLTIRDNNLILCEGTHGLKAFDISDPKILDQHLLDTYTNVHAVDAISLPGNTPITVVIGEEGFYQFQLNPTTGFELLSLIPVK
ncbi:LVIVD repeat-containing protein [Lewinella sp. LCG006]|uniref:LVIVD repeat-containing protein n=1 Tax=Lewinella sp. LCG006 TaxID=3231911 RepID=UPI003460E661